MKVWPSAYSKALKPRVQRPQDSPPPPPLSLILGNLSKRDGNAKTIWLNKLL